ncbi:hypothetical protein SCP_0802450 [Sparassis crispa]|uniref:Uncharacterized protein n=1 Tax=Sparassis crispa TaxID=139825 RepID=A0A401GU61_9APHY|nr:hypothetical protein SCP_0802450 [Sparassis crispa]GBE85723.1 hypothetical protein SCP_0802450 [Sparassis crispa]
MPLDREALRLAMQQRTPPTPRTPSTGPSTEAPADEAHSGHKRPHDDIDDSITDEENVLPSSAIALGSSSVLRPSVSANVATNLEVFTANECKKARLDETETAEVQAFNKLTFDKRLTRLYIKLTATDKRLGNFDEAKKQIQEKISPRRSCQSNIKTYAHAILLDPCLHGYHEKVPIKHLLTIIKRMRFDLPVDIKKNCAHWQLIKSEVGEVFTQRRRAFKEEIKKSTDWDIYTIMKRLIGDSGCKMSLELIARVAIMRCVFFEEEKTDNAFWIEVDKVLAQI